MIVHGGALERARGLDLGADDVVSFPFEPLEFAAKIRTQFRERQPEMELEAKLKEALKREHLAQVAVEALSRDTNTRPRSWLMPAILGLSAAAVLAALVTVISNGHSRKETRQLKAEVARLNGGILQQGELLRRAEQARVSLTASDTLQTRESLKAQTNEIRKKIAADTDTDGESLKKQLQETQNRLNRLENEGRVAENDSSQLRTQRLLVARGRGVSGQRLRPVNSYLHRCHGQGAGGRQGNGISRNRGSRTTSAG